MHILNMKMKHKKTYHIQSCVEVEEEEIEEEEEMEEDEIGTSMQSSVTVQQSCSRGAGQLFLHSELGGGGRGGEQTA